jgi:hypothetical protein
MTMRRIFHNHRIHSSSEGTQEISQLRSGWRLSKNTFQVPEGRTTNGHFFSRPSGTYPMTNLFPALKRRAIFRKSLWDCVLSAVIFILFSAAGAAAETTNTLSASEIQGRQLAQQLCDARPETNFTQTGFFNQKGILKIHDKQGNTTNIFVSFRTRNFSGRFGTDWETECLAGLTNAQDNFEFLSIKHWIGRPNRYAFLKVSQIINKDPIGNETMTPFAHSDFWVADLGLEFFHWPEQKILPKPTNLVRGRDFTLLESTNPNPSTNGYSRVLSWIDKETGGPLQAEAYDFNGKLLKEFMPKSFKKVNGQWALQEMEIRNVQTGSRTRLEFDIKK